MSKTGTYFAEAIIEPIGGKDECRAEAATINKSLARLKTTNNPMFAWEAISLCVRHDVELPAALVGFVGYVAGRLTELGAKAEKDANAEIKKAVFASEINPPFESGPIQEYFRLTQSEAACQEIAFKIASWEQDLSVIKPLKKMRSEAIKEVATKRNMEVDTLRRQYAKWEGSFEGLLDIVPVTAADAINASLTESAPAKQRTKRKSPKPHSRVAVGSSKSRKSRGARK